MERIMQDKEEYSEYVYKKEREEFEKDIIDNATAIFGEKTIYIDMKKRLSNKKNKDQGIPDGYLLDYTDKTDIRLYVIENETHNDSIKDHIAPQLTKFALNYKQNGANIKKWIIGYFKENGLYDKLEKIAIDASFRNIDDCLETAINKDLAVIIAIDIVEEEHELLKNIFRFDLEFISFKKFVSKSKKVIFRFDKFHEEELTNNKIADEIRELDTIIVPAREEGFNGVFLGQNCWYEIRIGINMLDNIKYIAAYQTAPISAITYYAEVDGRPELYKNSGKYIIKFKNQPVKLNNPITLKTSEKAPQSPRYTNSKLIINDEKGKTLDDIF